MIIYAIYIIKSDGKPILYEHFQSNADWPNEMLVSGLFIALNGFSKEVLKREITTIILEDLSYHIRSFGFYTIVLVTDLDYNPAVIIEEIGLRFIKCYSDEIHEKNVRMEKFVCFKKTIREIIQDYSFDESRSINPSKILSTAEIFSLSPDLQPIALAILAIGEGSLNDIADECDQDIDVLESKVSILQKLGYIGTVRKNQVQHFFCNRFPTKVVAN